jgi:curved DNA-binding protein CbpA
MTSSTADASSDLSREQREDIDRVFERVNSNNFFEVLGIGAGATSEQVRAAFHDLSRRFHPDRFFGKSLGAFGPKIERIFRRAVEVNEVLSNPEKRAQYLQSNAFVRAAVKQAEARSRPVEAPKSLEQQERDAERRHRLAKHPYLARVGKVQECISQAEAHISRQQFSQAFTLLNTALSIDTEHVRAKQLLSQIRKGNEQNRAEVERHRAEQALVNDDEAAAIAAFKSSLSYDPTQATTALKVCQLLEAKGADPREIVNLAQRAVNDTVDTVTLRMILFRALLASGMKALAAKQLEVAQRLAPEHADVKKQVKKRWPF